MLSLESFSHSEQLHRTSRTQDIYFVVLFNLKDLRKMPAMGVNILPKCMLKGAGCLPV